MDENGNLWSEITVGVDFDPNEWEYSDVPAQMQGDPTMAGDPVGIPAEPEDVYHAAGEMLASQDTERSANVRRTFAEPKSTIGRKTPQVLADKEDTRPDNQSDEDLFRSANVRRTEVERTSPFTGRPMTRLAQEAYRQRLLAGERRRERREEDLGRRQAARQGPPQPPPVQRTPERQAELMDATEAAEQGMFEAMEVPPGEGFGWRHVSPTTPAGAPGGMPASAQEITEAEADAMVSGRRGIGMPTGAGAFSTEGPKPESPSEPGQEGEVQQMLEQITAKLDGLGGKLDNLEARMGEVKEAAEKAGTTV